jgi:hypothetical protein
MKTRNKIYAIAAGPEGPIAKGPFASIVEACKAIGAKQTEGLLSMPGHRGGGWYLVEASGLTWNLVRLFTDAIRHRIKR